MAKFTMKSDYYEFSIKSGNQQRLEIEVVFYDKEIPENELRAFESALRLLLEACGRYSQNPSRR
jgi:hypothetical protein